MRRGGERGQITVLTIGFVVILGLLTVVVVNASAAFLQRRELLNLADRAALTAADGLDRDQAYRHGLGGPLALDPRSAQELAAAVVPPGTTLHVQVEDGIVHVVLSRQFTAPVVPPGWTSGTTVRAESSARLLPPTAP